MLQLTLQDSKLAEEQFVFWNPFPFSYTSRMWGLVSFFCVLQSYIFSSLDFRCSIYL